MIKITMSRKWQRKRRRRRQAVWRMRTQRTRTCTGQMNHWRMRRRREARRMGMATTRGKPTAFFLCWMMVKGQLHKGVGAKTEGVGAKNKRALVDLYLHHLHMGGPGGLDPHQPPHQEGLGSLEGQGGL